MQAEGDRPILITGHARSGTTWFGHMLHSQEMRHYHEPFGHYTALHCPRLAEQRSGLDTAGAEAVAQRMMAGADLSRLVPFSHKGNASPFHRLGPWRLFKHPFGRILIKDPTAVLLSKWLAENFDAVVVAVFRHPCGVVDSLKRLKWDGRQTVERLSNCPEIMALGLHPYAKLLKKVDNMGYIEQLAVRCAAINRILWNFVENDPSYIFCNYDEYCIGPFIRFKKLDERLGIRPDPALRRKRQILVSTQKKYYNPHDVARESAIIHHRWKRNLSRDERIRIRDIWMAFDLPLFWDIDQWISEQQTEILGLQQTPTPAFRQTPIGSTLKKEQNP